ncbi:hypothetical protein EI77_02016 [Prosthecobacter fusiformis]|uniref:Uncharacterized protein n=1 Tax=Prosthecobacter fusiformis TaxID=48464 RepID=A0A4R7S0J6_9BACT|nr:hypothetical protein [Prosthecobacter fusiformis]TDU70898.1 hypothetical protein EI77_02016 [Prosthecobacter fusiformis]
MKKLLILTLTAAALTAQADSQAWVRQTNLTNGMLYDIPLTATGGPFQAPLPVSDLGSTFELYARGTAWDTKVYLLDTKLIRAYAPEVMFQITTEDSYVRGDPASSNYVRRTRADRPFGFTVQVSGLVAGSSAKAEREVYFTCHGRNYDPLTFSGMNAPQYLISEANLGNGNTSANGLYHQLSSPRLSAGCGEQVYTFVRYAADGVPDTILAQPKVEVWPVATASVENITSNQVFIDRIPSIIVRFTNLYPDSRTFVQVYPGTQSLGTDGTKIKGTEREYGAYYNPTHTEASTNVPQNIEISMDDLSNYAAQDGIYTLEVVTETPFFGRAPERLLYVTFEVDRVISSRGQISTTELSTGP